ncbi:HET-domain-containing protein [Xylaria scruposa]|nr:HET-domain-containing protein [Xylaria scruposa]
MQSSSTFLYEPLERTQKEFRLLTIFAGREEEALQLRLTHATLGDLAVSYETISYCWGDASVRSFITVNGDVVDVPASAVAALKCMRKVKEPRIVWIDSVCINQADLDERAYQVGMMADIYSSARGNLVYLGESDEQTRYGLGVIERLYQEIRRKTSDFSEFHNIMSAYLQYNRYADDKLECGLDEGAIAYIFQRPWFHRLWIIQEAAVAVVNTCFCGRSASIDLNVILRVAMWLCYHWTSLSVWFSSNDDLYRLAHLWRLVDDKDSARAAKHSYKQSMESLLLGVRNCQCSDPRDKVFAVLSLVLVDKEAESSPEISLLEIDYRKPCHEVMRDATRYAIQESNSLRILRQARHRVTDQDLELDGWPSWVVRADRSFDAAYDAQLLRPDLFHADANRNAHTDEVRSGFVNHDVLCASGYAISCIIEVSDVFEHSGWQNRARVADILRSLKVIVGKFDDKEIEDCLHFDDIPFDMAEAMMLSVNSNAQKASASDILEFAALLGKLMSRPSDPLEGDEGYLYTMLSSRCSHRRFFTGSGGYFGMAPRCVRAGDEIVILLGSSVPFALRPFKTNDERHGHRSFQLLGDVWVNGHIMDGYFVNAAVETGLPLERFFLV